MSKEFTIEDFPKLRAPHVRMKDEAAVMRAINAMVKGGASKLQVVTDFDRTITKQHVDGTPVKSSFGIFEMSPCISAEFKQKSVDSYNKYRPIEINTLLPLEEKIAAMEEWMILSENLVNGVVMTQKEIRRLAQVYGTDVREGTKELFELLNKKDVPILVFSAGLGDIVEAILKEHDIFTNNVKIVSNFFKFDGDKILGFKNKTIIHVFNKKEHAIEDDECFKLLKKRTNFLLMGDTTGDASMADGVENLESVLKIGFLYDDEEKNLPAFKEHYDIVLIDDQTMDVPLEIVQTVLKQC